MARKYLIGVSSLMLAVGALGVVLIGLTYAAIPESPAARTGGYFATSAEENALTNVDSFPLWLLSGAEGSMRALDAHDAHGTAGLNTGISIAMLLAIFLGGLLGFARLRLPFTVLLSGVGLTLSTLAGGTLMAFTGAPLVASVLGGLSLLALFGQMIATNLLPGATHPFVLQAEQTLRSLPPESRRQHVTRRVLVGASALTFGLIATAASVAIGGPVVVVATGAIATGLFIMVLPLIASIRLRHALAPHS